MVHGVGMCRVWSGAGDFFPRGLQSKILSLLPAVFGSRTLSAFLKAEQQPQVVVGPKKAEGCYSDPLMGLSDEPLSPQRRSPPVDTVKTTITASW